MARDHQRHRIGAKCCTRFAEQPLVTGFFGQAAIGGRFAVAERARRGIDVEPEIVDAAEIDWNRGEVDILARGIAPDVGDERSDPLRNDTAA